MYKENLDEVIADGFVPVVYDDALETLNYLHERELPMAVVSSHPEENLRKDRTGTVKET